MEENLNMGITPVQRFWRLLRPDISEIKSIYAYAVFNGLVTLSLPLGIQAIINFIQGGQISTSWIVLVTIVVLGIAGSGILQVYQLRITENLQQKIFTRAAFEFAYRIPQIKLEALYKHYAPELMNRFFDTISVQKGMSKILIDFSAASLQVIFGLTLLCFYHPFFVVFTIILILLVYVIFKFTAKRGLNSSLKESKHKYEVAHWLEEIARTSTTFKLAGVAELPLERTDKQVSLYLTARGEHFKVLLNQFYWMIGFKVIVATGLLAIGGILVMEQLMNIGQFIAAEIIILLIMTSVEKLIMSLETIYDVLTALSKIGQVTDMELEDESGIEFKPDNREKGIQLTVHEVDFAYPDQVNPTLDNISLEIKPGEKVTVSGPNGSGKSTLLHVLGGLYQISQGNIMYDGQALKTLKLRSLRTEIGDYLSQEQLFEGTLRENIIMGRKGIADNDVREALHYMQLDEFIKALPKGLETPVGPLGNRLPRSIVQRLLLARSIVGNPGLLLLEDSFEYIDENDRRKIIDYLTAKDNQWTLVSVSSDPYLMKRSDRIIRMKEGKIFIDDQN